MRKCTSLCKQASQWEECVPLHDIENDEVFVEVLRLYVDMDEID
jgi:hypothetical protein